MDSGKRDANVSGSKITHSAVAILTNIFFFF